MKAIHRNNGRVRSATRLSMVYISVGLRESDAVMTACEALGWLDVDLNVTCANSNDLDADEEQFLDVLSSLRSCDLAVVKVHGDPLYFKKFDRTVKVAKGSGVPLLLECQYGEVMDFYRPMFPYPDDVYDLATRYVRLSGEKNSVSLLLWFCSIFGNIDVSYPEPDVPLSQGLYRPGKAKVDETAYLRSLPADRPTVGIMFNQTYWRLGDLAHIDALIEDLESKGANTIPVFFISSRDESVGTLGVAETIEKYMKHRRKPRVDCIIMAAGFSQSCMGGMLSSSDGSYDYFRGLDVPILQAGYVMRTEEEWMADPAGMTSGELSISVIQTEFDGQVFAGPLGFVEHTPEGEGRFVSVRDRVSRISDLALAWARLRRAPREDVRVAVMLNMYPPSNGRLGGAAGLDTFESLKRLLQAMDRAGYSMDTVPRTSEEIVDRLTAGITNDLSWIQPQEIGRRAADLMDKSTYTKWLFEQPDEIRIPVCNEWGDPPGNITTFNCRIVIPGLRNGNVFIGIEPNRGSNSLTEMLYHDGDSAVPHQYLAYYMWIRDVFKADCIIHMGTHGTLEWLPGKSAGLSRNCFPDAVLGAVPNIYPFVIDDPGEGMAAKRRTSSVLIGYNSPVMTRSGLYGGLAELDRLLQTLMNIRSTMQRNKISPVVREIRATVARLDMWKELGLAEDASEEDVEARAELIYDYVSELKDGMVKDGLHVLGAVPARSRMDEEIDTLTRHRNGNVPSLREALAESRGYDLDTLLSDPSGTTGGELNGRLLDSLDDEAMDLIRGFREHGYRTDECRALAGDSPGMLAVCDFICGELRSKILGTSDEIANVIHCLKGGFVPPGPSGAPTRGNAHILPTGRNFYSMDPAAMPTRDSWDVGCRIADGVIERYVKDSGRYPENVGMVVWATDAMKTGGDDISYILYMLGVRPVWNPVTGKASDLEVIPLSELGRPRIDVTLRISGIFRDALPNILELLDLAFETVAGLDESEEENMIRKHLLHDMERRIASGMSPDDARARSLVRVFGDPAGRYCGGTGVAIQTSNWKTLGDLAAVYSTWGSYAYGRKFGGEHLEEEFVDRIASLDLTMKNMSDREFDLLDSDNIYDALGGMNAAVRAVRGEKPVTYITDTWDTGRPRIRTLDEETAYLFRSRILNPKWVSGLKEHGFSGVTEVSKLSEYILGWSATSGNIEGWMYRSVAETFVFDEDTWNWMLAENPYGARDVLENLLEAVERSLWEADAQTVAGLRDAYLECEGVLEGTE